MTINSTKNSDEFTSLKNKAETLMNENKLDEALSQYIKTVEIDPEYAEGYCNINMDCSACANGLVDFVFSI